MKNIFKATFMSSILGFDPIEEPFTGVWSRRTATMGVSPFSPFVSLTPRELVYRYDDEDGNST
jgi:hypothetical protein